jgi:hypothetical protein
MQVYLDSAKNKSRFLIGLAMGSLTGIAVTVAGGGAAYGLNLDHVRRDAHSLFALLTGA